MLAIYRALAPILVIVFRASVWLISKLKPMFPAPQRQTIEKLERFVSLRKTDAASTILSAFDSKVLRRDKTIILIHAASGEFEYAKPVIRQLSAKHQVVVSYFSPSYAKAVESFPGVSLAFPLPFDTSEQMDRMLSALKPNAVFVARSDVWPNLARLCRERSIPLSLFSATFSESSKSLKSYVSRRFYRSVFSLVAPNLFVVSKADQVTLSEQLGIQSRVIGDTRYDQVFERLNHPAHDLSLIRSVIGEGVFVAGSLWPEDLPAVLGASLQAQDRWPHTLIAVPHEPTDAMCSSIQNEWQTLRPDAVVVRLSQLIDPQSALQDSLTQTEHGPSQSDHRCELLIVDRLGWLADLYPLAQVAFVGGSFRSKVHSVMEPLAAGCVTFVGPFYRNNREAIEFSNVELLALGRSQSAVTSVKTADELSQALKQLTIQRSSDELRKANAELRNLVLARTGATRRFLVKLGF